LTCWTLSSPSGVPVFDWGLGCAFFYGGCRGFFWGDYLFCFSQVPWKPLRVVHAGLRVR
jgi:hypothetical protein